MVRCIPGAIATVMLLQVLLHKYTAQDDIIVGTPYANRDVAEVQGLMGPFLNTLAMRLDLAGDPSFSTVVSRARAAATQAFLHGSAPFAKVVTSLGVVRSAAFTPVYQV
jgi:non-ribosomal peptide synthetase component F